MKLFDTHTHLCDERFNEDRDDVLMTAADRGIFRMVEIADGPDEWDRARALALRYPQSMRCTLGLHPYNADQFSEEMLLRLEHAARALEVVGIGEIGLDYVKSSVASDVQKHVFERLLTHAKAWDMPVVIHCREAYDDLLPILSRVFPSAPELNRFWGVVHCFSGTTEQARHCVNMGFALGADGPVTYPKNNSLRDALKEIGPDSVVLETDCPYLPPQSRRGQRNDPSVIAEIAQQLADIWQISLEECSQRTTENACALYRWKRSE